MISQKYKLPIEKGNRFKGRRVSGKTLSLIFKGNNLPHSRVATIISKKIRPSAVSRNKLKRLLIHQFKKHLLDKPCQDFLILPHQSIVADSKTISEELLSLMEKAFKTKVWV